MIGQELEHPIDRHSRELIVSNIELLLNYCLRFYDRQFITREEINHSVVKKFISLLDEYIAQKAEREGLITSNNYFRLRNLNYLVITMSTIKCAS